MAHLASPLALPLGGGSVDQTAAREAIVDALGQDVLFTDDFQLAANGDKLIVEGTDALRQALRFRLLTRPGEIPWRPNFGVGLLDYVAELGTSSKREELKRRVRANFLDDPRLTSVESCDVAEETINGKRVLIVQVCVQPITGTRQVFEFREAA